MLYLPFFEGSGDHVTDESIYGNHGTWTPETWTEGKIGPAPIFDGIDDYIDVTEAASLNNPTTTGELTIVAWIYTTDLTAPSETILSKDYRQYELWLQHTSGELKAYLGDGTTYDSYLSGEDIEVDVWHHVAVTVDGTNVKFYVDGALVKTLSQARALGTKTADLNIGARPGPSLYFTGVIDEVRVYSRVLEAHEIDALYRATV